MPIADKITKKVKNYAKNKAKQVIFGPGTTGERLQRDLKLTNFNYAWIMKMMGVPIDIFVIVVDSRFPRILFPFQKVKNLKTMVINRLHGGKFEFDLKKVKYTPPILLKEFTGNINNNAMIIRVDVAGEMFYNKKMYEQEFDDKKIRII